MNSNSTAGITSQDIAFSVLYSVIMLAGITGNIIVLVIVRKTLAMHTVTNYLLANLAIADLLTLLFCPGAYDFALKGIDLDRVLGEIICKVFVGNLVVAVTINASLITLCAVAIERYLALVKPFKTNLRLTKKNAKYAIGVIWVLSLLSNVLDLKQNNYVKDENHIYPCDRPWRVDFDQISDKYYIVFICILVLIVPVVIICFCYWQIIRGIYCTHTIFTGIEDEEDRLSKIKLCKLLVLLAAALAACCLPFAMFFLYLAIFVPSSTLKNNLTRFETLYVVHRALRFLVFFNSFINPILYAMQSSNYRQNFKKIFFRNSQETQRQVVEMDCRQGRKISRTVETSKRKNIVFL